MEGIFNTPDKMAKLHIAVTVAYIVFIILLIIGILVVILNAFGFFG
jgi:hypothetical protein